jgi:hypothetical protein
MTDAARPRLRDVVVRGWGVVLGWHVLLVAGYALWASQQSTRHSPASCDGLGWGCTPNPRDGALIVGIVYGPPVVGALLAVAGLLTAGLAVRVRSAWAAGSAGTFVTWLVAAGALAVWLRNLGE